MEKPTKRELARRVYDQLNDCGLCVDVLGGELEEICRGTPYEDLARKALAQIERVTMDDFLDAAGTSSTEPNPIGTCDAEDLFNRLAGEMCRSWVQVLWTLARRDSGVA